MINTILTCISNTLCVYFSSFPYLVYREANNCGNFAFAGVGLGLIRCQQMFWGSNIIACLVFSNVIKNYFINSFLLIICFFLYITSLIQINHIMKFFTLPNVKK